MTRVQLMLALLEFTCLNVVLLCEARVLVCFHRTTSWNLQFVYISTLTSNGESEWRFSIKTLSADTYNKKQKNRQFYNIGVNVMDTAFFVSLECTVGPLVRGGMVENAIR